MDNLATLKINAAILDVSGAFENVRLDISLNELATIGCSENIINFVHFLLNNREIQTEILGDEFRTTGKGVPQRGVLSPLLYLVYVKDIASNIPRGVIVS